MCSFLCLLPYKKPQWVEINDLDRSQMSVAQSEGMRSQMTARRMKMAYEYTRVTQVFTISSVPPCWVYPVSLLVHAYNTTKASESNDCEGGEDLAIQPNFPDEETLAATLDQYYTELVPGREYQTLLPTKSTNISETADLDTIDAKYGLTEADLSQL